MPDEPGGHTTHFVVADAEGNVVSLDMAAGRSWADDFQMEQILCFEKLASLTVEGPGGVRVEGIVARQLEAAEAALPGDVQAHLS